VSEFVVELYVPREDAGAAERSAERLHLAAEQLTREGTAVRYLQRIFVPEDETCLLLCEAESAAAVTEAAQRAGVPFERVAATLAGGPE
jgi:Protein of unknown function (DUF4242)